MTKKFHEFEILEPFYVSYSDGSFCIFQKITLSAAKVVCIKTSKDLPISDFTVGSTILFNTNEIYGKILNK